MASPYGKVAVSNETKNRIRIKAKKREVYVYTLYGDYFATFTDLHKCGEYFNTDPPNIHRKMNILQTKKILIDSKISKYLVGDERMDVSSIKKYWDNIFAQIKNSSGKYKIHDCFGKFIGTIDSRKLCNILQVDISSVCGAVTKNRYIKSLKITK